MSPGQNGSLDGYRAICGQCGYRITNTVEYNVGKDMRDHIEWMAENTDR